MLAASDPDAVSTAAAALSAGHIVGLPTETVYGLAVLRVPEPLAALIAAKHRPPEKGIALLLDDIEQVSSLVVLPQAARELANRFWPGPLTIVVDLCEGIAMPDALTGGTTRIGIRVPDHRVPRALARLLGPLAVTSANLSGRPEATTAEELVGSVGSALAVVIDDGPSADGGVPSTVASFARYGSLSVLRSGAIEFAALEAAVREAS
ncbi:L-threonylcarbamoyladenylate synthase [soil metagenome]